jgi:hypothetical protein
MARRTLESAAGGLEEVLTSSLVSREAQDRKRAARIFVCEIRFTRYEMRDPVREIRDTLHERRVIGP